MRRDTPPDANRPGPSLLRILFALLLAWTLAAPLAPGWAADDDKRPVRVQMDEVEIEGELEHPEVFYIIPRREMRMDLGALGKDYRDQIMEPLLPDALERWVRGRSEE